MQGKAGMQAKWSPGDSCKPQEERLAWKEIPMGFLKKIFLSIYLFERDRQREKSSIFWFTALMAAMANAEPI